MPGKDELGGELPAALKELLRHYHDMDQTPASVAGLHCYRALRRQCHSEAEARRALVDAGLDSLASRDLRLADLDDRLVLDGIETLVVRNLVEQRAQNRTVRYAIHNLTRTFLYQQIVAWGDAAGG